MRFKALLVSAFVLASAVVGTSASSKSAKTNQQPTKSCRCSPAFPGSIPHCGSLGGANGGGATGSGGTGG